MELVILRSGTLIAISPDGRAPCPAAVIELLSPFMSYIYRQALQGHAAYDPATGHRHSVSTEARVLFKIDSAGRLCTGYGYLPRVFHVLRRAGYSLRLVDVSPPRSRPDCYKQDWDNVRRHITFRPRQEECLRAVANSEAGIIDAVTGFGKTHLFGAHCLLYPQARIDIVLKPTEVADKLASRLTEFIPNVGRIGGGTHRKGRVTVINADSLHHADGDADFLLGDEVHQLAAPSYSEMLASTYLVTRNFGYSASPEGRFDGADAKLECFFGPPIFRITYPEAVALGLVVPVFVRWIPVHLNWDPVKGYSQRTAKKRWGIWRNQARNQIIAETVREYPDEQQCLILVESIEHAVHLGVLLPEYMLLYDKMKQPDLERYKKHGLLPQDYRPLEVGDRFRLRDAFEAGTLKKVISTDVWATGVDFPQLDLLVRAEERDGPIISTQGPGRPSRLYLGKSYATVIDFIDHFNEGLLRKSRARRDVYRKKEWADDWPTGRRQISRASNA